MPDIRLETLLIERFVLKSKRERYIGFVNQTKTRGKFISELSNGNIFDDNFFVRIEGSAEDAISNAVKLLKVKDCYIISENEEIDGKRLTVEIALDKAISPWSDVGTVIVFGNAEVVYREHEGRTTGG